MIVFMRYLLLILSVIVCNERLWISEM